MIITILSKHIDAAREAASYPRNDRCENCAISQCLREMGMQNVRTFCTFIKYTDPVEGELRRKLSADAVSFVERADKSGDDCSAPEPFELFA